MASPTGESRPSQQSRKRDTVIRRTFPNHDRHLVDILESGVSTALTLQLLKLATHDGTSAVRIQPPGLIDRIFVMLRFKFTLED